MAKVTYKGENKSVKNQGYTLPRKKAVEMADRHAARLFWNPLFDVKGLPKAQEPAEPEKTFSPNPDDADLGPEGESVKG